MKFQVSDEAIKIFLFNLEGPLWKSDEAKQLQGELSPKGHYPDNPPLLFPNPEDDSQEGNCGPLYFMWSNYVCRVSIPWSYHGNGVGYWHKWSRVSNPFYLRVSNPFYFHQLCHYGGWKETPEYFWSLPGNGVWHTALQKSSISLK